MARIVGVIAALTMAAISATAAEVKQSVYVLCQDAGVLAVIDTDTDEVSARIVLDGKPASFAINPVSGEAFITQPETGKIVVADLKKRGVLRTLVIGGQPFGVAVDSSGNLYAGDWSKDRVAVIDSRTGAILKSIPTGRSPAHLALSDDGSRLFVANRESDSISVIDTRKQEAVKEIGVGHAPFALTLTPDQTKLIVANAQSATLSIIDTSSLRVVSSPETHKMPYGLAATKSGSKVLVANQANGSVSVFDVNSWQARAEIRVGRYPEGLAVIQNGSKAYVANWFSATVSVIDLSTDAEIKRIKTPDGPRVVLAASEH